MKIVYVGLRNIMGIEELDFEPGKITVVEGKNGRGKTSILKALQGAVGGGHDATLLREGEDTGEVVLVFDDGKTLHKKIRAKGSKVSIKDDDGKELPRAASMLKDAIDDLAVNPIKILTANAKERVKLLLDSVEMEIPRKEIEEITGIEISAGDTRHPLHIIQEQRQKVFDERTDNNRFLKEKVTMVDKMREGIPFKKDDTSYEEQVGELEYKVEELEAANKKVKDEAYGEMHDTLDKLKAEEEEEIEKVRAHYRELAESARQGATDKVEKVTGENNADLVKLSAELADARAKADQAEKLAGQIEYVKEGEQEIKAMEKDSETLTKQLEKLDKLKAGMLENLPIEGLEVKEGDLYLDDVPFDSVNKAKRVQFALTVAGMRSAECPIVCVDNLEALDAESFEIFQEQAAKTDMQFFVTRVSDKELEINTTGQ